MTEPVICSYDNRKCNHRPMVCKYCERNKEKEPIKDEGNTGAWR